MGLFDNVTSALNRGVNAAERTGKSTKLKMSLNELTKQRRELAAQLGASLYDEVKDNEELRAGREVIFDGIAAVDEQRAEIERQLAEIEEAAAAAREAAQTAQTFVCPNCGTKVPSTHAFCTGCGTPLEQIRAAATAAATPTTEASGRVCVACGTPLEEDDIFCIACGTRQPDPEE